MKKEKTTATLKEEPQLLLKEECAQEAESTSLPVEPFEEKVLDETPVNDETSLSEESAEQAEDIAIVAEQEQASSADSNEAVDETKNQNQKGNKRRKKKKKIDEITFENDIKYRGPFSYRWLRIFAWACIVAAQIALILGLGAKVDAKIARNFSGLVTFLQILGTLAVPFFLIANFAVIINAKNGYKRLIASYAFLSLIIFALFVLIYQRYLLGITEMLLASDSEKTPEQTFQEIFREFSTSGYLSFNIFIDLFLCTLFTFFINYNPKKVFVGKKTIIFRLFAILPVLYEVASLTLKTLCVTKDGFVLPIYVSPFLTTKPPITFLVFVVLAFFIKNRERLFLKRGKTFEEYNAFLKTNINSLHFSIATSVCMFVAVIIDIILYFVIGYVLAQNSDTPEPFIAGLSAANELGFGDSISLLLVIPFLMLFSYTRTHKPSAIDIIIPNIGMAAFAICYVEGLYQLILRLPALIGGLMN